MIERIFLPPDELLGRNAARNKLIYLLYQEGRKVADIAKLWPLSAQQVYISSDASGKSSAEDASTGMLR